MSPCRRAAWAGILLALASLPLARPLDAGEVLAAAEEEYAGAARAVLAATVTVVPSGVRRGEPGFSSGVLVTAEGLLLSDGDAGLEWRIVDGERVRIRHEEVNVRVYDAGGQTSRLYQARVLFRDLDADTSLIRIANAPPGGFPFVALGRSADLRVGRILLAAGTAFDEEGRAPPTATAGVVASFDEVTSPDARGTIAWIYTTAAVNQGVNGGPVVDLEGRLVGTVSTWQEPAPGEVHQFLGKVAPIDRVLGLLARAGLAEGLVQYIGGTVGGPARHLEVAFGRAADAIRPAVVSLEVKRRRPLSTVVPTDHADEELARFHGPVSGLLVAEDGTVVTSLYNLTNVQTLVHPLWRAPAGADLEGGLDDVEAIRACLPDGREWPMRVVGRDDRLGIALLEPVEPLDRGGEDPAPRTLLPPFTPAPAEAFQAGRFVVTVGNPYGTQRRAAPLVTAGVLSKLHADTAAAAWRGQWQTDAGGLDTNCGGAAVDVEGRLLGMLQLWHPARHGRNSGVAFVVPWRDLERAVEKIRSGRGARRGFLGVSFASGEPRLDEVVAGSAAEAAGLAVGDVIRRIDRSATTTVADVITIIGHRCAGDVLDVTIDRNGRSVVLEVVLGARDP